MASMSLNPVVIAIGNAFDGIRLFGPFLDKAEALIWASGIREEWVIVEIEEAV